LNVTLQNRCGISRVSSGAGICVRTSQYDQTKKVTITGTLTKVDWRNPHIEFSLDVKDDSGRTRHWVVESLPPNRFASHDIERALFTPFLGRTLIMEISPTRDGSPFGILRVITFPDGSVVNCGYEGVGGNCTRLSAVSR
jgi:hypothetical protein